MRLALGLLLCSGGLLWILNSSVHAQEGLGSDSPWTGAQRCGSCHEGALKTWQKGPHARAAASLAESKGDGRCESCHGTGNAPAGLRALPNVQCEACHGAGRHYSSEDIMRDPVLAKALGLRELATQEQRRSLCMRCHVESTSILPFDVEKAWLEIAH